MEGDPSAGNFFKNLFGPNVSIVSSEDANSVVARNNGLSVDEFFQPFSCVGGKEPLTSRDVGGNLHSVSNIKILFKNLASKIIPQDEIDRRLQASIEQNITPGQERVRIETEIYNLNVAYGCPWYNHYREIYLAFSQVQKHERLNHILATLLVVSSENSDPMSEFRKLADFNRNEQKRMNDLSDEKEKQHYWFSDSTQVLFLLIHDVHNGSEAKAQEVYANLKQTFGENSSYLLRINSSAASSGGDGGAGHVNSQLDPWKGMKTRLNPTETYSPGQILCDGKDQDAIRVFIRELTIKGIIPHMEREGYKLAEIIQNRKALHRSLFSATRKLFGSGNSKSGQLSEKYSDSVDIQIRKLADLQFLMQQYHKSAENYSYAKREMSNDQNWVEATSAAEMSSVAAFMAGARETFPKQVSAHAINSYTNCNRPKLAIKCALITLEAVRAVGAHVDAAKDYLKFVNIQNTLLISLFTEQAALCYLKARFPRQFAFQSVLAGHQYKVSNQRHHSIRNYLNAQEVIQDKGWKQAELHVNEIIGIHALQLGDKIKAERHFNSAISLHCGQNPTTLQNYFLTIKSNQSSSKPNLTTFPSIKMPKIEVQIGSTNSENHKGSQSLQFENTLFERQIGRIRKLENQCAKAASDGIVPIKYKESFPSTRRNGATPNSFSISANIEEDIYFKVPIYNQLLNTLQISDIKLLTSDDVQCEIERTDDLDHPLLLDSHVEQVIIFRIKPKSAGLLSFIGLSYSLTTPDIENCEIIQVQQNFETRGPRLTRTTQHKKNKMYGPDKRLELKIVEKSPRIKIQMESALPTKLIAGEIIPFNIRVSNVGNAASKDVWFNSNQSAYLKPLITPPESSNDDPDSFTFNLSSLPGPIQIGSLAANESRLLQMKLFTQPRSGKNLIELIVYCEADENGLYLPQSDGISLETEIVAPLELDLNILPAPINCSKRALQVEIKSLQEDSGATCRYVLSDCLLISNKWKLSKEEKQPLLGLQWIQGQNASSLCFVEAQKEEISTDVREKTEGKRPWRREMFKTCRLTKSNLSESKIETTFLSNTINFTVPEPIPEDDVIKHTWLEDLANENVSIIIHWRAEVIDGENGLRNSFGQSHINLPTLYSLAPTPTLDDLPLKCYISAPHRVEHSFGVQSESSSSLSSNQNRPCRVTCQITIENVSDRTNVSNASISFQQILDSLAGLGSTNQSGSFTWAGMSEKRFNVPATKKIELKNVAVFPRAGTFDLANFELNIGEIKIQPRQHMIVINDI